MRSWPTLAESRCEERAETRRYRAEIIGQIVRAREELRVLRVVVGEAREITVDEADRLAVLTLRRRQKPAIVRRIEQRRGFLEIVVLGRLRLRAAELVAHCIRKIARRDEHAEFPVRHVVHEHAGRKLVVAEIAAALVEQRFGAADQRRHGDGARDQRLVLCGDALLGDRGDVEMRRLVIPPPHERENHDDIGGDDDADRPQQPRTAARSLRCFVHDPSPLPAERVRGPRRAPADLTSASTCGAHP